jgi:hypothetical protein
MTTKPFSHSATITGKIILSTFSVCWSNEIPLFFYGFFSVEGESLKRFKGTVSWGKDASMTWISMDSGSEQNLQSSQEL